MNATDRLRQAAQALRDTAQDVTGYSWQKIEAPDQVEVWTTDEAAYIAQVGTREDAALIALMANPPMALLLADWLEDIAADKDSGLGCIHPRALDVTDLILGGNQ